MMALESTNERSHYIKEEVFARRMDKRLLPKMSELSSDPSQSFMVAVRGKLAKCSKCSRKVVLSVDGGSNRCLVPCPCKERRSSRGAKIEERLYTASSQPPHTNTSGIVTFENTGYKEASAELERKLSIALAMLAAQKKVPSAIGEKREAPDLAKLLTNGLAEIYEKVETCLSLLQSRCRKSESHDISVLQAASRMLDTIIEEEDPHIQVARMTSDKSVGGPFTDLKTSFEDSKALGDIPVYTSKSIQVESRDFLPEKEPEDDVSECSPNKQDVLDSSCPLEEKQPSSKCEAVQTDFVLSYLVRPQQNQYDHLGGDSNEISNEVVKNFGQSAQTSLEPMKDTTPEPTAKKSPKMQALKLIGGMSVKLAKAVKNCGVSLSGKVVEKYRNAKANKELAEHPESSQ